MLIVWFINDIFSIRIFHFTNADCPVISVYQQIYLCAPLPNLRYVFDRTRRSFFILLLAGAAKAIEIIMGYR